MKPWLAALAVWLTLGGLVLKAIYKDIYWFLRIKGLFKHAVPKWLERRKKPNRATPIGLFMSLVNVQQWQSLAEQWGGSYGVDPLAILAIIAQESQGNPNAVNNTGGDALRGGSYGLMQMSLKTAQGYGYTGDGSGLLDPSTNIEIGTQYLRDCFAQADGDINGAAQAYNSGRTNGAPTYASNVINYYVSLGGSYGTPESGSADGSVLNGSVSAPVLIALAIVVVLAAIVAAARGGL